LGRGQIQTKLNTVNVGLKNRSVQTFLTCLLFIFLMSNIIIPLNEHYVNSSAEAETGSSPQNNLPRAPKVVSIGPNQTGYGKYGQAVTYNLTVTNLQTVSDYIDITYTSQPNGMSVTLFKADGVSLLLDSIGDGDSIPDTGLLTPSSSIDIKVKVTIPSDKYINELEITLVYANPSTTPSSGGDHAKLVTDVKPFLDITQSTDPSSIYIDSAEIYNLTIKSRVTLNVSGGGLPITTGNPLDVVLTLDNSGSMQGQPIADLVTASNNFVNKLNDEDRLAIYCFQGFGFAAQPRLLLDWTTMNSAGKTTAHNAINSLLFDTNYYTPIWDTIHDAIAKASTPTANRRPIVIAMTDGENNRNNYGVNAPVGPWPPYDNDGNVNDDWLNTITVRGLCEAPMTVFTIGLGINPGGVQENQMTEIAMSSNPSGDYYYAPSSSDLDEIYDSIAKKIMNVSGVDPNPNDNKPMITYVLPDYIEFVPGTFKIGKNSIETDPIPDIITYNAMNTTLGWDVGVIYINDSWVISFEITSSKAGWVPVNLYPDSFVYYTNQNLPNLTIPFPEIWIEVIPLPDLVPSDVMINDIPYPVQDVIVNVTEGQDVKISARTINIGLSDTIHFSDHFEFIFYQNSVSNTFFETDISSVGGAKTTDTYTAYWRAPDVLGLYKLYLFADSTDLIPEGIEAEKNNIFNITIDVQSLPIVDLILTNIVVDDDYFESTYINISVEIDQKIEINAAGKNQGTLATNYYSPSFYIAFYNQSKPLEPFMESMFLNLNPSKKTSTQTSNWQAPSTPGIYNVILFIDSTELIPEEGLGGENNNKIYIKINVTKDPLLDLILTNVRINGILHATTLPTTINVTIENRIVVDLVVGQTVKISSQGMNFGDTPTTVYSDEFFISYHNVSTELYISDEPFLYDRVESLSPLNKTDEFFAFWTAPMVEGTFNLKLIIDPTDLIPEGLDLEFEDNNVIDIEFHVHELPPPPEPEIIVDDDDVFLSWHFVLGADYYYIYGGPSPETIDFKFPLGKSSDPDWTHRNILNEYDEYFYIIRSVDIRDWQGTSSYILGFRSIEFKAGYNTFSLPLAPFEINNADWYLDDMLPDTNLNGNLFRYNSSSQKWIGHPKGLPEGLNDFKLKVGITYMFHTSEDIKYTFVGRPGKSIKYIDGIEDDIRIGLDIGFSRSLSLELTENGILLNWNSTDMISKFERVDHYNIYRSPTRGLFGFGNLIWSTPHLRPDIRTYIDSDPVTMQDGELYYIIVPVNTFGREGSSTYSVAIAKRSYRQGYNSFALPYEMNLNVSQILVEFSPGQESSVEFPENENNTFNVFFHYNMSAQKWVGIPALMPPEFKHYKIEFGNGYLVYTSKTNINFSFISN